MPTALEQPPQVSQRSSLVSEELRNFPSNFRAWQSGSLSHERRRRPLIPFNRQQHGASSPSQCFSTLHELLFDLRCHAASTGTMRGLRLLSVRIFQARFFLSSSFES